MVSIAVLGALVIGTVGVVYLLQLAYDRDAQRAAERTAERSVGLITGAGSAFIAALVIGVDALLSAPEVLLTVTGIGAIISGTQWEIYLALAVVIWIVSMVVERRAGSGI